MANSPTSPKFIVGIGASAGGLEALERFFSNVPNHPDVAYVVIQHLSPDFKSMMPQILARVTHLPLHHIQNGMVIESNTIYLNVPRHDVVLSGGRFVLTPTRKASTAPRPINLCFNSIAAEYGSKATGIILSGSGQDGAEGLKTIESAGGLALVQDLESALFSSMPKSAAQRLENPTALLPEEMANFIVSNISDPTVLRQAPDADPLDGTDENALTFLISTLRKRFEIDFTRYKPYTLFRRLDARIQQLGLNSLAEYSLFIKDNIDEQNLLYRDLLIDVTAFFRDEGAFRELKETVLPGIIRQKHDGETIRIWVAACATGEEAYSIALLLEEEIGKQNRLVDYKIFATDAHHASIATASEGIYQSKRLAAVPAELQNKYFAPLTGEEKRSVISPKVRSKIVFATHNLLENPHFSRLDMISCRNLLIYIDDAAQEELLFRFHSGLRTGGVLFLGPSEQLRKINEDYDTLSSQWRIYRKIGNTVKQVLKDRDDVVSPLPKYMQQQSRFSDNKNWESRLLQQLVETGYVVDGHGTLKEVFGDGRKYLQFKTGKIALTLTNLLPENLAIPIRTGLQLAQQKEKAVNFHAVNLIEDETEEGNAQKNQYCSIDITPFQGSKFDSGLSGKYYLITISEINIEIPPEPSTTTSSPQNPTFVDSEELSKINSLERELTFTRESLQATIEEMQSSNEELQSANEELQSTNEELSSVNEELFTVNSEFQEQNQLYTQLNDHMRNMLAASHVNIILLDNNFNLMEVTPLARDIFGILDTDLGRSILHFTLFKHLDGQTFQYWMEQAKNGYSISETGQSMSGLDLKIEISQYLSEEGETEGLILSFTDLSTEIDFLEKIYPTPPIFERLSENTPSLILVQNILTNQIVFSGGPFLEKLGYSSVSDLETFASLLHPDDKTDINTLSAELKELSGPEIIRRTNILKNVSGEPVLCKVSEGVYQRSETGELIQSISIITPIDDGWLNSTVQG